MKIVLHGFGTYAIVFRHLVEAARRIAPEIEWAVILPTPHHRDVLRAVLRRRNIERFLAALLDHVRRDDNLN